MLLLLNSFQLLCANGLSLFTDSVVAEVLHFNCKSSLISIKNNQFVLFPLLSPYCVNSEFSRLPLILLRALLRQGSASCIRRLWVHPAVPPASRAVRAGHSLRLDARINGIAGTRRESKWSVHYLWKQSQSYWDISWTEMPAANKQK